MGPDSKPPRTFWASLTQLGAQVPSHASGEPLLNFFEEVLFQP